MSQEKKENKAKKIILFLAGFVILILGISLVLFWWKDVVIFFRGILGMVIALSGLVILYFSGK